MRGRKREKNEKVRGFAFITGEFRKKKAKKATIKLCIGFHPFHKNRPIQFPKTPKALIAPSFPILPMCRKKRDDQQQKKHTHTPYQPSRSIVYQRPANHHHKQHHKHHSKRSKIQIRWSGIPKQRSAIIGSGRVSCKSFLTNHTPIHLPKSHFSFSPNFFFLGHPSLSPPSLAGLCIS